MRMILSGCVLAAVLCLSGCSYFSSASKMQAQDKNYLSARSIPALKIPPGVSSNSFDNDTGIKTAHTP